MGFLKPDVQTKPQESQATPLANDLITLLRNALQGGGDPSAGLFETQKQTTSGLEDFIAQRSDTDAFAELMGPLRKMFNRDTDRESAQIRETLGAQGHRFSSSLANTESKFRGERATDLDALMAQKFMEAGAQALSAFGLLQNQQAQNLNPLLMLADKGVLPEHLIVEDSPWKMLLSAGTNVASSAAGKPTG